MSVKPDRGGSDPGVCRPLTSSARRWGVIARRSAILLGSTAAIALSIAQPVSAIVVNDQVAAAVGGIANYYDAGNQFPNVVSLFSGGSFCTGSLINSRTILTAAHCFAPNENPSISFAPIAGPGAGITSFVRHPGFVPGANPSPENDIAVISLAQPVNVTSVAPVKLLMLQPGQPGFPTVGTTITMVGYGLQGTGSSQPAGVWIPFPADSGNPPPEGLQTMADGRRRVAMSSLGLNGVPFYLAGLTTQPFFVSQFRDPLSPNDPNFFNLPNQPPPLEGGTAGGDSGGPLFAVIGGQPVQIGVVRGGREVPILFCAGPGGPQDPVVCPDQNNPVGVTGFVLPNIYGQFSDWTPINLFLQWINENSPLRQVTAAAGNFNWSNPAAWIDAFADPARPSGAAPDNTRGSVDINANQAARYYDVTLSNPGTMTLNMNPQIDTLSIAGAQAQLVIGAPYTLEVLLGTTLSAGTLTMAGGTLATSEFLMSGGLLTGGGTIGGSPNFQGLCGNNVCVTVTGGTVAPVGTLSIQGNYTQTGGLLQFQLAPAGANGKLAVTNTATLGGTSTLGVTVMPGLYGLSTPYALLTAGAISGQFAQFISVSPPSAFLSLSGPIYNPTSVDVTVTRTPFGALAGLTANQRAVGNALEAGYSTTLTGPAATLYTKLLTTGTPDALTQLSGEVHGSVQAVIVDDSRYIRQAVLGRLRQAPYAGGTGAIAALGSGGPTLAYGESATDATLAYADKKPSFPIKAPPLAAPVETPDLTFWAQGVGAWGKINGDGNAADASRNLSGVFTGFDRRFGDWRAGLAAGYSNSSVSVSARASSANIDTAYVAAYAGTSFWAWNFRSGATFAWNTIGTSRTIAFPSFFEQATTRYGAGEAQVFGELGYGLTFGAIAAEPFAGLAWVHLDTASFTETGGVSALAGSGNRNDVGYSTLGARVATYYLLQNGMALIPRASVAWQHAFGDVTPTAALSFQSIGAGFNIFGVPIARDAALVEAGGDLQLTAQAKIGVSYAGQLANSAHDHSVKGNFTWRF
jgi:outer membrane autotransporter protein